MAILQNTTVSGSLVVTGDLTARQYILSSSVSYFTESFASGSTRFGDSADDNMIMTGSFKVSGSTGGGFIITGSTGYVGMGILSPAEKLHVSGGAIKVQGDTAANTADAAALSYASGYTSLNSWGPNTSTWGGVKFILNASNGSSITAMTISGSGQVGIGIAAPTNKLYVQVDGAGNEDGIVIGVGSNGDGLKIVQRYLSNRVVATLGQSNYTGASDSGALRIYDVTGTETIRLSGKINVVSYLNAGNVGIGTNAPSYTLDVQGTSGAFFGYSASSTYFRIRPAAANGTVNLQYGANAGAAPDLIFSNDSNVEKMRITNSGNVGIGITNPNNKLDVSGNTVLNGTVSFGTAAAAANSFTFYQNYSAGQPGTDWYSSAGAVIFGFNGNTKALFLGNLTGGATTLSTDASGNIIRTPSDVSLKTNIENLQYGLETVMQLRPIIHNWEESIQMGEGKSIGFIAQEVETLIPEVISGVEYKSIDYPKLIPVLVKAIQELSAKVTALENR